MKCALFLFACFFSVTVYAANPNLDPVNSVPSDNATGVAVDADIVLVFDIDVVNDSSSALIELYDDSDNLIESFNANGPFTFGGSNSGSGTISNNTITLNPGADFILGTGYYILIPSGSDIIDQATGDLVTPVTSPTTYNFTTASGEVSPVPTMSIWGIGMLAGMMGLLGMYLRRRH
ncbi:IPTL-CTERM sorting domain-containing protein [Halopseudomonas salegens]|uniref:IPTL-CTERM protein sorting domain-containing protein n=1 Tax=Halopseudomonas salegens TaxID=1434072 RepID=A0A1H2HXR4_9GAMM|nr:IPTL-CTERM sorting domain-containing protein [Halopseudomonas salegens]SDU36681.1 IPTL-CTERM protein sorting domain-containing protein [Halopseudomonas salegens]